MASDAELIVASYYRIEALRYNPQKCVFSAFCSGNHAGNTCALSFALQFLWSIHSKAAPSDGIKVRELACHVCRGWDWPLHVTQSGVRLPLMPVSAFLYSLVSHKIRTDHVQNICFIDLTLWLAGEENLCSLEGEAGQATPSSGQCHHRFSALGCQTEFQAAEIRLTVAV